MGFYGNKKIPICVRSYPNRFMMEKNVDEIFYGNSIKVDYSLELPLKDLKRVKKRTDGNLYYNKDNSANFPFPLTDKNTLVGEIVYFTDKSYREEIRMEDCIFYLITAIDKNKAAYKEIVDFKNLNSIIDEFSYGQSYDQTIWIKDSSLKILV